MEALYEAARAYEEQGDHYNAIKLYKRVVKDARHWHAPYIRLGHIYKERMEWKPALYYNKKAISLSVEHQDAWWNVGIAATALNKRRLAKSVWAKFNLNKSYFSGPVSIRLAYGQRFEVLWAKRLDPARARVKNIPHPRSGRRYHDTVLLDHRIQGHHSDGLRRLPIYNELGLYKASTFSTFSCLLHNAEKDDILSLQQLCHNAGLGFEVWANAARAMNTKPSGRLPEFYTHSQATGQSELIVAMAAKRAPQAKHILHAWKAITLKDYSNFQSH